MTYAIHQETKSELEKAVYRLWKEKENGNFNPAFEVIEKAIELVKKGLDFNSFSDVLSQIESDLTDEEYALDEDYYAQQEEQVSLRNWASQL
jgi:hypothetical protein